MFSKVNLVLKKSEGNTVNNVTTFVFNRGIRFNEWRIKNLYIDSSSKVYLHCDEIAHKTINSSLLCDGSNTNIIFFTSNSLSVNAQDNDRFNNVLNEESVFYKMSIYFTSDGTTKLDLDNFIIVFDLIKTPRIY